MNIILTGNDPGEHLELIRDLWHNEAALYAEAHGDSRRQALHIERSDELLDAYLQLSKALGSVAILAPES